LVLYTSHKNVQNSSEYNFTGENSGWSLLYMIFNKKQILSEGVQFLFDSEIFFTGKV
jgi:hypothetical protein